VTAVERAAVYASTLLSGRSVGGRSPITGSVGGHFQRCTTGDFSHASSSKTDSIFNATKELSNGTAAAAAAADVHSQRGRYHHYFRRPADSTLLPAARAQLARDVSLKSLAICNADIAQ
jgi:hypothetical protein